jgi:hypothetical protein
MNQRTLLRRLLSPAGFGLVLIFFLLPFVTVSCGDSTGTVEATFSGLDMAIGGSPHVTTPDRDPESSKQLAALIVQELDLEPVALLAALAVLAGMVMAAVRPRRIRYGAAAAFAVAAAALMVGAITRAPGHVDQFLKKVGGAEGMPEGLTTGTHTRYGFWLALIALVGLAAGNGFALLRSQRAADLPPAPPEPEPERLPLDELT